MAAGFPAARPRRLRRTPALRRLAARTAIQGSDLVLPMFVKEGIAEPVPVPSMPGVVQHTRDSLRKAAAEYGLRVDVTAPRPSATALVDALAEHGARLRDAALAAGEPVRRPSERRRGGRRRIR